MLNDPSTGLCLISEYSSFNPFLPFNLTCSTNCSTVSAGHPTSQCRESSSEKPLLADDGGGGGEEFPPLPDSRRPQLTLWRLLEISSSSSSPDIGEWHNLGCFSGEGSSLRSFSASSRLSFMDLFWKRRKSRRQQSSSRKPVTDTTALALIPVRPVDKVKHHPIPFHHNDWYPGTKWSWFSLEGHFHVYWS